MSCMYWCFRLLIQYVLLWNISVSLFVHLKWSSNKSWVLNFSPSCHSLLSHKLAPISWLSIVCQLLSSAAHICPIAQRHPYNLSLESCMEFILQQLRADATQSRKNLLVVQVPNTLSIHYKKQLFLLNAHVFPELLFRQLCHLWSMQTLVESHFDGNVTYCIKYYRWCKDSN